MNGKTQKWVNAALALWTAVALIVSVVALMESQTEYQTMSASGYLFSLEDGTGTVRFSVSDDGEIDGLGAIDVDGAATLNSTLDVDGATTLGGSLTLESVAFSGPVVFGMASNVVSGTTIAHGLGASPVAIALGMSAMTTTSVLTHNVAVLISDTMYITLATNLVEASIAVPQVWWIAGK